MQNFNKLYKKRDIFNYAKDKRGPIEVINNLLLISDTEKYSILLKKIKQNYESIESVLRNQGRVEWNDYIKRKHIVEEDMQEITRPFIEILENSKEIFNLRKNIINKVNKVLDGQVRLRLEKDFTEKDKKRIIDDTVKQCRWKFNIIYEKQILLKKWLTQVVKS